jgi:hypothetical protein
MSDADRALIRARIDEWAAPQRFRIGFVQAVSFDDQLRMAVASGVKVSHGTDDEGRPTIILSRARPPGGNPPSRSGLLARLRSWLRR